MRSFVALVAVLAATVVAPFVIATSWLSATVEDRAEYVDTVAPLADDPGLQRVLAEATAKAAVEALQRYVPIGLPDAVSEWALAGATRVVESPGFVDFWRQANDDLHAEVIAILEDPDAETEGRLTVDASPLVAQVLLGLEERGVPSLLLPRIELQVPVVPRSEVAEAGPKYRAADAVRNLLPLVWAALVLLALLIAPGWRGRVRFLGLALVGVAGAALVVRWAVDPVTDLLIDGAEAEQQQLARIMIEALTGSLAPYARGFLLALPVGLLLMVVSLWPRRRRVRPISGAPDYRAA